MIRIAVRPAMVAEFALVAGHVKDSASEASSYRGHLDPSDGSNDTRVVVTLDETVVGSAAYADAEGVRTISHIYVRPECREIGAGDALMEWLVDDATAYGIIAVRAAALPGDRATKNLFERHGLVARAIQVERRLR